MLRKKFALIALFLLTVFGGYAQLSPAELAQRKQEKMNAVPQGNGHSRGGAPEQDCVNAIVVCQGSYYQPSAYSGFGNSQEVPITSCLGTQEKNSVWYFFTVETSGTLEFTIDPNDNSDDYDFALYNMTGRTCSDIISGSASEVRCNYCVEPGNTGLSSAGLNASEACCDRTGCQFSSILNVTAGQSFALVVSNYSSSQSGYSLTFGGTTTIFDQTAPIPVSVSSPCGANFLTLQMSESIWCTSVSSSGSEFSLTGTGGPFTVTGARCGSSSRQIEIAFSPPLTTNGSYTLTINTGTDNNTVIDNCGNELTAGTTLNFTAVPTPPVIMGPDSICKGSPATLSASQGTSYTWNTGANTQTITINPLTNTTYSVTVANGLCSGNDSHTVNVKESPVANFTNSPSVICVGQQVSFTNTTTPAQVCLFPGFCIPSPLTNYVWTFGTGATSFVEDPVYTYNTPGTYEVTLFASDFFSSVVGCTNTRSDTLTVLPNGGTLSVSNDTSICAGASVTLVASGGSSYTWTSRPPGFFATTASITVSPTISITYIVTSPGCSTSTTDSVRVSVGASVVTVSPGNPSICNGDFVMLTASGNNLVDYTWSPAMGLSSTSGASVDANPAVTTVYNVIATTANGCTAAGSATVTVNQNPAPSITPDGPVSFCTGDSVTLDAGAGYLSYVWNTGESTRTITVDSAGTFIVTVFDNNGCFGSASIITTISSSLNPMISGQNTICPGASTTLDAGAGYTNYSWSTGELTRTIVVTQAGAFTVTVSSGSCFGVSQPFNVIVSQNLNPSITVVGAIEFCIGDSSTLIADAGYLTYSWSTGATTESITATQSGSFDVSVTDNFGCSGTSQPVTLTVYNNPTPVISPPSPITICVGSNVDLNAGTYSGYSWSTGATTQIINVTQNGSYDVTVTDANGCRGISSPVTLTVVAALSPVITSSGQVCDGKTVTLDAGAGYATYSWSTGAQNSRTIEVLQGDDYYVTVTDAHGCSGDTAITVVFFENPSIVLSDTCKSGKGTVVPVVSNGMPPYAYVWTNGSTEEILDVLDAGNYSVTVTDDHACSAVASISVACPVEITYVTVPSAFSPNGDGKNDFLTVLGDKSKIRHYEFGIFNRWGQKVFYTDDLSLISESSGSGRGWDGFYKGNAQDVGVFSYYVTVEFMNGTKDNINGSVTLVR